MKILVKDLLVINAALGIAAQTTGLSGKTNYAIGKNIKNLKKAVKEFYEDDELRIRAYSKKNNAETGNPEVDANGKYDFGKDHKEALEKYKELTEKEIEVDIYTIERTEDTDKISGIALSELLDVIIIDK